MCVYKYVYACFFFMFSVITSVIRIQIFLNGLGILWEKFSLTCIVLNFYIKDNGFSAEYVLNLGVLFDKKIVLFF